MYCFTIIVNKLHSYQEYKKLYGLGFKILIGFSGVIFYKEYLLERYFKDKECVNEVFDYNLIEIVIK